MVKGRSVGAVIFSKGTLGYVKIGCQAWRNSHQLCEHANFETKIAHVFRLFAHVLKQLFAQRKLGWVCKFGFGEYLLFVLVGESYVFILLINYV